MRHKRIVFALGLLVAAVLLTAGALAQDGYELTWWTADGGGGIGSCGGSSLAGTAGEADAAGWSDGDYALVGGFWPGTARAGGDYSVYLPLVMKQ